MSEPAWTLRFDVNSLSKADSNLKVEDLLEGVANFVPQDRYARAFGQRCCEQARLGYIELWAVARLSVLHGAGARNLLEVPLAYMHPQWSVPVVHGESVKGACRAEAKVLLDQRDDGEDVAALFGTIRQIGELEFADAWWVPIELLEAEGWEAQSPWWVERLNPRETMYHGTRGESLPGLTDRGADIIPQLAACGTFAFWVKPPLASEQAPNVYVEAITALIRRTLTNRGLGSSVNVDDYGRFELLPRRNKG